MYLKTENSRRVAKSRPVCMGLYHARYIVKVDLNELTIYMQ